MKSRSEVVFAKRYGFGWIFVRTGRGGEEVTPKIVPFSVSALLLLVVVVVLL